MTLYHSLRKNMKQPNSFQHYKIIVYSNNPIRMISEGSYGTDVWRNYAENTALKSQ